MRALQVKEDFVASVSHELRTPLASVLGHLEMLVERDDLPPGVQRQLQVIERNAVRLRSLVSDLLQVAQAVDGGVRLHRSEVDLVALVDEAVESARPAAEASGLSLVIDAPERLVATVDGERLRQVVDNLVTNAVKYTETGGTVTVGLQTDDDGVQLWVTDTGIGMDDAEIEQVFSWFVRGEEAVQRQIPGTGLGLNIVSTIVAAHGGKISVESAPGEGSTFRVTLPA